MTQESQMRAWSGRAFAAVALMAGATYLGSVVHDAGETNHRGFVSSANAQPQPIRRLIEWLRSLTLPAGIVRAEGRIEATQVDVSSKYAGEVVDIAVQEGDKVAVGQMIARMRSPELEAQMQAAQSDVRSAKEAQAQDAVKAAEAKVEQIKSMMSELTLVSPREGKVQYQLARAGDSVAAGAPIVTLIDLTDVYMTVFLRAADAGKLATEDEARLILDAAPDYVVPAAVSFVASSEQSATKAAETKGDFARLMLRVDLRIDPKVVETYYGKVETGLRGAGFVRTRPGAKWPADLQVKLPPAPVAQEPTPVPAPVAQDGATASTPIGGGASGPPAPAPAPMSAAALAPVAEASKSEPTTQAPALASAPASAPIAEAAAPLPVPVPSSQPMSAPAPAPLPAPSAEASRSSPAARVAKLAPLPPPIAQAPAHAPAAQASTSEGLGPEPAAEVAPESLAQLAGAWTPSAADCNKLFQRRGSALTYRQPVEKFAQAAIIESQRIRLPTSICRLERASHEGGALKVSGGCQDSISYTSQTAYVKLRSKNEIVFNPNGDSALDTSMTRCPL